MSLRHRGRTRPQLDPVASGIESVERSLDLRLDQALRAAPATDMEASLAQVLLGTVDASSPLRSLRGNDLILKQIFVLVCEEYWQCCVEEIAVGPPFTHPRSWTRELERCYCCTAAQQREGSAPKLGHGISPVWPGWLSYSVFGRERMSGAFVREDSAPVTFPARQGLYCNMLPFRFDEPESLPAEFRGYWGLIERCADHCRYSPMMQDHMEEHDIEPIIGNRVVYLTVDERTPEPGASQRRGGLHVESGGLSSGIDFDIGVVHAMDWGQGSMSDGGLPRGGIFMASTVADSTRIYNCRVLDTQGDVIGPHGDVERLRAVLDEDVKSYTLEANELAWITDRTPHESLPVNGERQYFRLVVGKIGAWYAHHSTANPIVPVPDDVTIVQGDKFASAPPLRWVQGEPAATWRRSIFRNVLESYGLGDKYDKFVEIGFLWLEYLNVLEEEQVGMIFDDEFGNDFDQLSVKKLCRDLKGSEGIDNAIRHFRGRGCVWPGHLCHDSDEDVADSDDESASGARAIFEGAVARVQALTSELGALTVAQLKERLAARGLSTEGNQAALQTRLFDALLREP